VKCRTAIPSLYLYFNLWLRVMMDILTRHKCDIYVCISAMSFNTNSLTAIQCPQTLKRWVYANLYDNHFMKERSHEIFYLWYTLLHCLPFFDWRIMITPLLSSNSSYIMTHFKKTSVWVIFVINLRLSLIVSIDYWSNLTLLTAELKPALICLTQTKRDMRVNGLMFLSFNLLNTN
jgi:hypothetical protein